MNQPNPNDLSRTLRPSMMTAAERAQGRFMRAPDGHGGGEGGNEGGDQGQADETLLGGAGDDDQAGDKGGEGEKEPGADADKQDADKAKEGGEGKQAEATGAPEAYDIKAPEGMDFDAESFKAAEPVLRELNLSNEQAQKLTDVYAKEIVPAITKRANDAILQTAADQRKAWADAFEADPEIGGAKKGDTLSAAARVFDHYGLKKGEGLRQLLDESGLGNHPDMIRFVARIGNDLAEGSFERGETTTQPKAAEQKLYGPEFQPK